jgi:hypothetical protein
MIGVCLLPKTEFRSGKVCRNLVIKGNKVIGCVVFHLKPLNFTSGITFPGEYVAEKSMKKWIKLTILRAELTRDVEILGKMDPYCIITCNSQ